MSPRLRGWLLTGWALSVVGVLALNMLFPLPGQENDWQWVSGLMGFPVAGAIILARRPGNRVGLALWVVGTATLISFVLFWWAVTSPEAPLVPIAEVISFAANVVLFAGVIAIPYIFPTGHTLGGWHAKAFAIFVVVITSVVLVILLAPAIRPDWADLIEDDAFLVMPLFALAGAGSLIARWRHAVGVERAQLRWLLTAAVAFLVMLVGISFVPDEDDPVGPASVGFVISSIFVMLAFWSIPAAIVVAILRYRLFEIDRIVSRTVSYALVAAVLAAVFAGIAIGLPQVLGLPDEEPLLVAGATLAAAALFNPLRRRVQKAVDRRFNRARYDTQQEVDGFAARLHTGLELDDIAAELIGVVAKTMQPVSATIWVQERSG